MGSPASPCVPSPQTPHLHHPSTRWSHTLAQRRCSLMSQRPQAECPSSSTRLSGERWARKCGTSSGMMPRKVSGGRRGGHARALHACQTLAPSLPIWVRWHTALTCWGRPDVITCHPVHVSVLQHRHRPPRIRVQSHLMQIVGPLPPGPSELGFHDAARTDEAPSTSLQAEGLLTCCA